VSVIFTAVFCVGNTDSPVLYSWYAFIKIVWTCVWSVLLSPLKLYGSAGTLTPILCIVSNGIPVWFWSNTVFTNWLFTTSLRSKNALASCALTSGL